MSKQNKNISDEPVNASAQSLIEATRSRAKKSGHGNALGAAGVRRSSTHSANSEFLRDPGQSYAINPKKLKDVTDGTPGFENIQIGVSWDPVTVEDTKLFGLIKTKKDVAVDLDLGCFYELQDGTRGVIQAFGKKFGAYEKPPYVSLLGDERTGEAEGQDEIINVNGDQWDKIKRILIYIYIYKGVCNWRQLNPEVMIDIPGENDLFVTLNVHDDSLNLCAVGGLENVRGGIRLTNHTEYFPGHIEMDRAFGFGLDWADGAKAP